MSIPRRLRKQAGRHALVDGIPFEMPVTGKRSPAMIAVFPFDADRARPLLPSHEIHPFRLWKKGLFVAAVIDYRDTPIGNYVEYSLGIVCTHGARPAPRLLPLVFRKLYGTGQFVCELSVSTEISVKGGKGIWGMPKHQGNLDFKVGDDKVTSQYDLDGKLMAYLEVERPRKVSLPLSLGAPLYCTFRGMLMKSYIYFAGKVSFSLFRGGSARLVLGDHPRIQPLKGLGIEPKPIFTAFIPSPAGYLDDHYEGWFLTYKEPPTEVPEGFESVIELGLSQEWPPPPMAPVPGVD